MKYLQLYLKKDQDIKYTLDVIIKHSISRNHPVNKWANNLSRQFSRDSHVIWRKIDGTDKHDIEVTKIQKNKGHMDLSNDSLDVTITPE